MKRLKLIKDARDVYPSEPSDKMMGVIFLNLGLRLVVILVLVLFGRWIIFSDTATLTAQITWGLIILLAVIHIGYFLYTFHLYLQENMERIMERRQAEAHKAAKATKVTKAHQSDTSGKTSNTNHVKPKASQSPVNKPKQ